MNIQAFSAAAPSMVARAASYAAGGADAGGGAATAGKPPTFAAGNFETFLRMLTTQLQNQDPMSPMENSEFAVQLATFSGVEQQVRTNQLLEGLTGARAGDLTTYAGWIGKEVKSTAPAEFGDRPITLDIRPDPTADEVVLVARDKFGRVASAEKIGQGQGEVDWFGRDAAGTKLPSGSYSFEIENWKGGKKLSMTPVETYARVTAVERSDGGPVLLLGGGTRVLAADAGGVREAPPAS